MPTMGFGEEYAYAKIEPMTIAAIVSAVGPILGKVLTPDVMKSIVDSANPTKHLNTLMDGMARLGKWKLIIWRN